MDADMLGSMGVRKYAPDRSRPPRSDPVTDSRACGVRLGADEVEEPTGGLVARGQMTSAGAGCRADLARGRAVDRASRRTRPSVPAAACERVPTGRPG